MEAHEGVCEFISVFAYDVFVVDIFWHRIVDVEQCHGIVACAHADVFRKSAIDVNLASHRNATADEAAVYIAWFETKLTWECRPAFISKGNILA